ncbi:MAG: ribonuclease III [Rhizobiales bacterium]|nr:ribonuclease III [Hyphomicrobiales bacterium]
MDELTRTIGHQFADQSLLTTALTHASAGDSSRVAIYQRLEFLGDRVLGLIIADLLYHRYREADEGELALRFNDLVRQETLAEIARKIDLGRHLVLGPGEAQGGGRNKDAILADVCEALLAALYIDGGMAAARAFIERIWGPHIDAQSAAPRDPKTILQEWSQGHGHGLPEYVEVARRGPAHAPVFTIEVRLSDLEPARAEGTSKREAERIAAQILIEREAVSG